MWIVVGTGALHKSWAAELFAARLATVIVCRGLHLQILLDPSELFACNGLKKFIRRRGLALFGSSKARATMRKAGNK